MTRPESQKPKLFDNESKRGLSVEERKAINKRERDIEMECYEAYLHQLNKENGIEVD